MMREHAGLLLRCSLLLAIDCGGGFFARATGMRHHNVITQAPGGRRCRCHPEDDAETEKGHRKSGDKIENRRGNECPPFALQAVIDRCKENCQHILPEPRDLRFLTYFLNRHRLYSFAMGLVYLFYPRLLSTRYSITIIL